MTLFHRGHREIVLTEAGYLLQARAQEMIALEEKTLSALQQSQVLAGTLNIGARRRAILTSWAPKNATK